ncbi:hypothetical protein SY27_15240 [Flavobacterium sp. 316]|uniref:head GIN domain-containing protein n=1 Tax=Flavobacterium sp. 316 TaxID=1603293 RepID=UPI0005DE6F4C|nr:head GIN domain-containing protein [Flavobacterium sp. 316]KIX19886.1 hypothetical protein SY27_15240 [Flavobacterium sp. 316]
MIKLIIQITKVIITVITVLLLQSCVNVEWNSETISGNGKVVTVNRTIAEKFNSVSVQTGLNVIIEQANTVNIEVQADDNLQDHIFTTVKDGVLEVYSDVNIKNAEAKNIYIKTSNLEEIRSSSGANVKSDNKLEFKNLELHSSSGSTILVEVDSDILSCESSSGSSLEVKGKANILNTESSSGSNINLENLIAQNGKSSSSSGSSTTLNVVNQLKADASSGSSIEFISKPNSLIVDKSSGGSVSQK